MTRTFTSTIAGFVAIILLSLSGANAASYFNKSSWSGVAIEGVDPVAYFADRKSVEGSSKFSYKWKGATKWKGAI